MSLQFYAAALVGGVVWYWFVLRRFNSLGFRLFSLFALVAVLACTWIYQDKKLQESVLVNGTTVSVKLLDKKQTGTDSFVTVEWKTDTGATGTRTTSQFISMEEYARFKVGEPITLLHDTGTGEIYVKESFERMLRQFWILYVFAGFFFLAGCGCWFFLRKVKVGVDDRGDEWLEKEDGSIILDERKSPVARGFKKANVVSKLWQIFGR